MTKNQTTFSSPILYVNVLKYEIGSRESRMEKSVGTICIGNFFTTEKAAERAAERGRCNGGLENRVNMPSTVGTFHDLTSFAC